MRDLGGSRLTGALSIAAGAALGVTFGVVAVLRRGKPLHPVGTVASAVLVVAPGAERSGSPLVDEAREHDCVVRASYAAGTGPRFPDIEGFAVRVPGPEGATGPADLLFASTGTGTLSRYLLTVRAPGRHGAQTTLLPVRAGGAPLQLRLDPVDPGGQPWPGTYELSWAHGSGRWHTFATLHADWAGAADAPERFDPVAHPLPGTTQYAAVAALREPAYHLARLARPSAGRLPG